MDVLLREQLVIEELYHQQKMAVTALKRENTELQQIKHMNRALAAEKKGNYYNLSRQLCPNDVYIHIHVFMTFVMSYQYGHISCVVSILYSI